MGVIRHRAQRGLSLVEALVALAVMIPPASQSIMSGIR